MQTPTSPAPRISVFGHESANPSAVATQFGGRTDLSLDCDLAIFAINAETGIAAETIEQWHAFTELQTPRMIVVTGIESGQSDFDDAVLIANRVLDQTITPYLVLHDEAGLPCALISLGDLTVRNYESGKVVIQPCEPEHETLVSEFRSEYLAEMEISGESAFTAGLLFPAIPIWIERGIGVDIVEGFIATLDLPSAG